MNTSEESKQTSILSPEETVLMIGNPGVGKSTLLNGLVGSATFKAGFSKGRGLTTVLQEHIDNNYRYVDTPGLSDIEMRKQAADEITKALQKGGSFAVFFVVTLESGRIRPDDSTTIKLVLDAASDIKDCYSIIINKATKRVKEFFGTEEGFEVYRAKLTEGLPYVTNRIYANCLDSNLEDVDDQVPILSEGISSFIYDAPSVEIESQNVIQIENERYDKLREELGARIAMLEKDKTLLEDRIAEQKKMFDELIKKIKGGNDIISKKHILCFRCRKYGHYKSECYSIWHADGHKL
mmetsp:Transcript_19532/g.22418  ORF Transcript_19532/g.22418 Transcript_19532/m.22418 type:complete len:295 (+) Transcript_19532:12-896(+)